MAQKLLPSNEPSNEINNLATLNTDGEPPKERVSTVLQAHAIFDGMLKADIVRSKKRALLKGMVDGNPPYNPADLASEGRAYQCNVNWRVAQAYFDKSKGAFYDIFSESKNYANIQTKLGTPEQQAQWSECITEHFDWLLRGEKCFDYNIQISQAEMVLYGRGPLWFEDNLDWRPVAVLDMNLKVPDRAKSDTSYWELATVERDYSCDELWRYIMNEKAAESAGWNVESTKQAIIDAHPDRQRGGQYQTWEWVQQELKNGSLYYGFRSKTVKCVHMFYREFRKPGEQEGRITQKIFLANGERENNDGRNQTGFLFNKIGRYANWEECGHPMYYDHGGGGYHHSVIGLGVAMYSAIEYQNRLLCNLADKAFTPKVMFKPTSEQAFEDFALQQFGDYSVLSPNVDVVQTPIQGVMEEGLVFNREMTNLISTNLSQYRSDMQQKSGNPVTATQVQVDASEQAKLGKTQLNRYYEQLDGLFAEMYRRATRKGINKFDPGGARALEFQARCMRDGVPMQALQEIESVQASRVIGQGSEFTRQQSLGLMMTSVLPMLPETGRDNLITDFIAAQAGYHASRRYYPTSAKNQKPDDQKAFAVSQVADMKTGTEAIVTDTQNHLIFAETFLTAASQAMGSLEQGGNPIEVQNFVELAGTAIAQHLDYLQRDPSRKQVFEILNENFKKLGKLHDQLAAKNQQDFEEHQQKQAELQQQQNTDMLEFQLKQQKQQAQLSLKAQGQMTKQELARQQQSHSMALSDAKTASEIVNQSRVTSSKIRNDRKKS